MFGRCLLSLALVSAALAPSTAAAAVSFAPAVSYPAGTDPIFVEL